MNGGPSHVDTFDPKPALDKWHRRRRFPFTMPPKHPDRRSLPLAFQIAALGKAGQISEIFAKTTIH